MNPSVSWTAVRIWWAIQQPRCQRLALRGIHDVIVLLIIILANHHRVLNRLLRDKILLRIRSMLFQEIHRRRHIEKEFVNRGAFQHHSRGHYLFLQKGVHPGKNDGAGDAKALDAGLAFGRVPADAQFRLAGRRLLRGGEAEPAVVVLLESRRRCTCCFPCFVARLWRLRLRITSTTILRRRFRRRQHGHVHGVAPVVALAAHRLPGIAALDVVKLPRGVRDGEHGIPLQQRQRRFGSVPTEPHAHGLRVKAVQVQQQNDAMGMAVLSVGACC